MKKQELCQFIETALNKHFNMLEINNISNYIWNALSINNEFQIIELGDLEMDLRIKAWIDQLTSGMPIQYVLQNSCFYGIDLEVNTDVLIPRPETEELVSWILSDTKSILPMKFLDIGTGSGCISIAIKKHRPSWEILGIDISTGALDVAKRNALNYNLDINFLQINFLTAKIGLDGSFDLIVSNPPYISNQEKASIADSNLRYEPHIALFPKGDDPLIFYREIAVWAAQHLKKSGAIYLEMNEFLHSEIKEVFQNAEFTNIEIREDMQGKPRMIKIKF